MRLSRDHPVAGPVDLAPGGRHRGPVCEFGDYLARHGSARWLKGSPRVCPQGLWCCIGNLQHEARSSRKFWLTAEMGAGATPQNYEELSGLAGLRLADKKAGANLAVLVVCCRHGGPAEHVERMVAAEQLHGVRGVLGARCGR